MAIKLQQSPGLPRPNGRGEDKTFLPFLISRLVVLFTEHSARGNQTLPKDGTEAMEAPLILATYTVATLPSASANTRGLIYVSDETGGAVPAFSDGTNWRRVTDRVVVS